MRSGEATEKCQVVRGERALVLAVLEPLRCADIEAALAPARGLFLLTTLKARFNGRDFYELAAEERPGRAIPGSRTSLPTCTPIFLHVCCHCSEQPSRNDRDVVPLLRYGV